MTSENRISRRLVLQAGAATSVLGAPGLLLAQPKPIKIGLVHPVSGGLAETASCRGGVHQLLCDLCTPFHVTTHALKKYGYKLCCSVHAYSQELSEQLNR